MEPVRIIPLLCILALLFCGGCSSQNAPPATTAPSKTATVITTTVPTPLPTTTATAPLTPTPDTRYPNALKMKSAFTFGNGTTWTSDAAMTRIWVNDTYSWYDPVESQYETRVAPPGKKYLFVFLAMINHGTERAPLPPQGNVYVISGNDLISPYPLHPLPKQNLDSAPKIARVAEIEYSRKLYSSEMVEDYGYSHGQKLAYINPGESNAVEGYIIYEVPESAAPERTFVTIALPDKSQGVWVLG